MKTLTNMENLPLSKSNLLVKHNTNEKPNAQEKITLWKTNKQAKA